MGPMPVASRIDLGIRGSDLEYTVPTVQVPPTWVSDIQVTICRPQPCTPHHPLPSFHLRLC